VVDEWLHDIVVLHGIVVVGMTRTEIADFEFTRE
jgi:hypothetical protein